MTGDETQQAGLSSFGRALYYPYFTIHDVNWLKAALLYWDEISRIVPRGYAPTDPDELKPAGEFILSLDPQPYTEQAEVSFGHRILPLFDQPGLPQAPAMLESVANAVGENRVWVHANKMTSGLRDKLERRGLLHRGADDRMFLDHGFDALYMICLANVIGLATGRPPVTDARGYADCQGLLQFDGKPVGCYQGPIDRVTRDASMLVELGIGLPPPHHLAGTSLEKVVEHHRKRGDERRAFRQAVEGIVAKASGITDPTALADYLNDQGHAIGKQIRDYRKALDEIGVKAIASVLSISVPAWGMGAVGACALAGTGVGAVVAGWGLTVNIIEWWAKVRSERRGAVASCPWHYWMDTQRRFGEAYM